MFQETDLTQWRTLKENGATTIDVRSPSEYESATIPGSINIPLFDDSERAEIGTLYKQVSIQAAQQRGLEIVSAKLPAFIGQFAQIPGKKTVFCWRGGMRSKTTATLLDLMGIRAGRLTGGYRAYRHWVSEQLEQMAPLKNTYVLHGNTGNGKTAILRKLKARQVPALDLEGMSGHRGSIFGEIGLHSKNQKMFDALLVEELIEFRDAAYFVMEAESKRIGKIVLPEPIVASKEAGISIVIELPLHERVKLILDDYQPWEHAEACLQAFRRIKARIHTPIAREIEQSLVAERYAEAVEMLLVHYYDPRYTHAFSQYGKQADHIVQAANADEAFGMVADIVSQKQLAKRL